jgi:hypothetical protein
VITFVNAVLDRAERMPWLPIAGGLSFGSGLAAVTLHPHVWGWPLLAAGLLFVLIKPAGTQYRALRRIQRCRDLFEQAKGGDVMAHLEAITLLEQAERSAGIRTRSEGGKPGA